MVTNVFVPQLETVAESHNVSLSPQDAPSLQARKRIGKVFGEFDSDSSAMIVLEGDQPLGADAHHYYDGLIQKLPQDTKHVEHIQDFWGDPLTAAGSQSADGKAALVQVYLAGNQGESLANESVDSVRNIVNHTPPPLGVKAYVTGAAPLVTDQFEVGRHGTLKTTLITIGVIALMLFSLYRRLTTVFLVIFTVMIELTASRGVVAVLANAGIIELSTYSTNLLTLAGHRRRNRLCDLHSRPLPRSALHRAGPRLGVQHDVPRNRAHHLGFGPDDCRRGVLSDLHSAPVFQEPRHSRRNRRPCRSGGGVDPGAGVAGHRPPFRSVRTQPPHAHPGLAAHRHGHRPLARTHPGGDDRRRRSSVCSPYRDTRRVTTPAPTCLPVPQPMSVTRPRSATFRRRG